MANCKNCAAAVLSMWLALAVSAASTTGEAVNTQRTMVEVVDEALGVRVQFDLNPAVSACQEVRCFSVELTNVGEDEAVFRYPSQMTGRVRLLIYSASGDFLSSKPKAKVPDEIVAEDMMEEIAVSRGQSVDWIIYPNEFAEFGVDWGELNSCYLSFRTRVSVKRDSWDKQKRVGIKLALLKISL